jgi:hypothetical protein
VQFVHDALPLSGAFFHTNIIFERRSFWGGRPESSLTSCSRSPVVPSSGSGMRAGPGKTTGVDGVNPGRIAGNQDRMSG